MRKAAERGARPWVLRWALVLVCAGPAASGVVRTLHNDADFAGFHKSARVLLVSQAIPADQERYFPTFQFLLLPLAALPLLAAVLIWMALNLASVLALPWVLRRLTGLPEHRLVLPAIVVMPFLWDTLVLAQSGLLLLLLAGAGVLWSRDRRAVRGGAMLGLAGLFKVLPIAFLCVPLILRRARRAMSGFLLAAAAILGGLMLWVGADAAVHAAGRWAVHTRQYESAWALPHHGPPRRYNNQGLAIVIVRSFCDLPTAPGDRAVHLTRWPVAVGLAAYAVLLGGMVCAWGLAAWKARMRNDDYAWMGLFALTSLLLLAVSPLVWTHYFLWWLPATAFLARRRKLLVCIALAGLAGLFWPEVRALGVHAWLTVALFAVTAGEMLRRRRPAASQEPLPAPRC